MGFFKSTGEKLDKAADSGFVIGEKKRKVTPRRVAIGTVGAFAAIAAISTLTSEEDASPGTVMEAIPEGGATGAGVVADVAIDTTAFAWNKGTDLATYLLDLIGLEEIPDWAGSATDSLLGDFSDGMNAIDADFDFSFND